MAQPDCLYSNSGDSVKVAVSSDDELPNTQLRVMIFHGCLNVWSKLIWSIAMAEQKASIHFVTHPKYVLPEYGLMQF